MAYSPMSGMKCSGWCATACLKKSCWHVRCSAVLRGTSRLYSRKSKQLLEPTKGIISDGEETIRSAVAFVFPDVPHQLCHFHYLKDAIKPFYEADQHAKTELKKQLRGVRPID